MSSYIKKLPHPITGKKQEALCIDDYFGQHEYGYFFLKSGKNATWKSWDKIRQGHLEGWDIFSEKGIRKELETLSNDEKTIRQFETGATRDTDLNKNDYEGFICPLVMERFGDYMTKHRFQSDGNIRESDNWQNLFGDKHLDVCMKSGFRHFHAWWKAHRGYKTEETIEDSICALIFNAQAYLHKLLKDKN